jgi:hypothetical protein
MIPTCWHIWKKNTDSISRIRKVLHLNVLSESVEMELDSLNIDLNAYVLNQVLNI